MIRNAMASLPQDGRRALVAGTGGLGFEAALALVQAGAELKGPRAFARSRPQLATPKRPIASGAFPRNSRESASRTCQSRHECGRMMGVAAPPSGARLEWRTSWPMVLSALVGVSFVYPGGHPRDVHGASPARVRLDPHPNFCGNDHPRTGQPATHAGCGRTGRPSRPAAGCLARTGAEQCRVRSIRASGRLACTMVRNLGGLHVGVTSDRFGGLEFGGFGGFPDRSRTCFGDGAVRRGAGPDPGPSVSREVIDSCGLARLPTSASPQGGAGWRSCWPVPVPGTAVARAKSRLGEGAAPSIAGRPERRRGPAELAMLSDSAGDLPADPA